MFGFSGNKPIFTSSNVSVGEVKALKDAAPAPHVIAITSFRPGKFGSKKPAAQGQSPQM